MTVSVSVIIRNRNEAEHLAKVLVALSVQSTPVEIILVDNGSTNGSVEQAKRHGAKIVHLKDFTYGRALNVGLREATGEICVILSAHSLPLGREFIANCVQPFHDPKVAAVRCVYTGKTADELRWIAPEVLDSAATLDEIISKGPLASGCAIRRSVWEKIPFDETVTAAEDKLWAREVLKVGYTIISPCEAFYSYLKVVSPHQRRVIGRREAQAVFDATGERLGALKRFFAR